MNLHFGVTSTGTQYEHRRSMQSIGVGALTRRCSRPTALAKLLTQAELLQQIYRVTRSVAVGGRLAATPVFAIRAKANVTSLQVAVCLRLRAATPYPRPTLRTKKYCSFINYGLSHYPYYNSQHPLLY